MEKGLQQKRVQAEKVLTRTLSNWREIREELQMLNGKQGRFQRLDSDGLDRASQITSLRRKINRLKTKKAKLLLAVAFDEVITSLLAEIALLEAELVRLKAVHEKENLISAILKMISDTLEMAEQPGYRLKPRGEAEAAHLPEDLSIPLRTVEDSASGSEWHV